MQEYEIPYLSSEEIRQAFFDFFASKDHKFIPSDAVYPKDDPTLLFTNAGMNQFKSIFLGENPNALKRVHNAQKCLRVSGKHNDLDEVGRDTYHHTFFEMLGNWSFGDYFKKEAIVWAWELLTEVWKLPKDRLYATVYLKDDEAEKIWLEETDIDPSHVMRFEKDNYWEMGSVGPCGASSEIHFDLGPKATQTETYNDKILGVNGENERYIEIWNLVFMQEERLPDGSLIPLKAKHVDTGAGFERLCMVIQGKASNYDTDVFTPLIKKISELAGVTYDPGVEGTPQRVIADHVRALSCAVADGATPGNEGRGYVLRRILRRASRFAHNLGVNEPVIYKLLPTVIDTLGKTYPELVAREDYIAQVIEAEERRFLKTLDQGVVRFNKLVESLKSKKKDTVPGKEVFSLYDTYGFPTDLTKVMAEEVGLKIDEKGYEACMEEQRQRARGAQKFQDDFASDDNWTILKSGKETEFLGYDSLDASMNILRYLEDGDIIFVVADKTPFYAESGGQVGDQGWLKNESLELKVEDTIKVFDMWIHRCSLVNGLVSHESMKCFDGEVSRVARESTKRNHSATHLLHYALRQHLGDHVTQQGSSVGPQGLRFDFTHHQGVSQAELDLIEDSINEEILSNLAVDTFVMGIDEAKEKGAMALFGEKYGETVRVVNVGPKSIELCGGTHAHATGDIGSFVILGESSIAAGIRRIEAITGKEALAYMRDQSRKVKSIATTLKVAPEKMEAKVKENQDRLKTLEKELSSLKTKQIAASIEGLLKNGRMEFGDKYAVVGKLSSNDYPKSSFQPLLEGLASKLGKGVAVFTQVDGENLSILAAVGNGLKKSVKAGDLVKSLATIADGRGGGRPDRAQGGSKHPEKEGAVITEAKVLVERALS